MMRETILLDIRSARGEMFVELHGPHDVYYVKVVKSDLIRLFEKFKPYEETGFEIRSVNHTHYCEKDLNIY